MQEGPAQITWYHNITLLDKVKQPVEREWYIRKTIEHGWSRNVLVHQIDRDLYHRQGRALTNFERTLPAPQSDLAQELLKDPYHFDFLERGTERRERDRVVVEYALRSLQQPIGVAEYRLTEELPRQLQDSLPTVEQGEPRREARILCSLGLSAG